MRFPDGARLYVIRPNEIAVGDTIEQDGNSWIVERVERIAEGRLELILAHLTGSKTSTGAFDSADLQGTR